ncbi:MAG: PhoH family protein [Myxococcales bacterium]|nr:PhoH family protein [Myxococcales bacterium]
MHSAASQPVSIIIPDTSALIENPEVITRLVQGPNVLLLPQRVIEELGALQHNRGKSDGVKMAAREVTRRILDLRAAGLINHGVRDLLNGTRATTSFRRHPSGGIVAWEPDHAPAGGYDQHSGDNVILATAQSVRSLIEDESRFAVRVISEDGNLLLKCDSLGIRGENLRFGKIELSSPDDLYRGHRRLFVDGAALDAFLASGEPGERAIPVSELGLELDARALSWNEGVILVDRDRNSDYLLTRFNPSRAGGVLEDLRHAQYWDRKRARYMPRPILGFTPGDPLQVLALEFLLDPTVALVVIDGRAGSGKTRLTIAAALYLTCGQPTAARLRRPTDEEPESRFHNGLLLLRPEYSSSSFETGFLPGDLGDKIGPWLAPALQAIRAIGVLNEHDFLGQLNGHKRLHMTSTALLRGLDIEGCVAMVDELQNGDRHLAKTLMSRFSHTAKVMLTGCIDPVQIDNPYVDWRSNALSRIKHTYRDFGPYVAQISLEKNYRGPISTKADEL